MIIKILFLLNVFKSGLAMSPSFECLVCAGRMRRHILIDLPFIPLPPGRGALGVAGWVENMTHYDRCYDRLVQECNPFDQPARLNDLNDYRARLNVFSKSLNRFKLQLDDNIL